MKINYFAAPGLDKYKLKDYRYSLDQILENVSQHFNIKKEDILRKTRLDKIVEARQVFCYISTWILNKPYGVITVGKFLGLTHGTVIHSRRNISNLMEVDKHLALEINTLIFKMGLNPENRNRYIDSEEYREIQSFNQKLLVNAAKSKRK